MPPTDGDASHAARLRIHQLDTADARAAFASDAASGLRSTPKQLFPKYFYDELGSELFDAICLLPEYYLTRAENEILAQYADEIIAAATTDDGNSSSSTSTTTTPLALLELGSGSATKTRRIIEALLKRQSTLLYLPVDISASALRASAHTLLQPLDASSISWLSAISGARAAVSARRRGCC